MNVRHKPQEASIIGAVTVELEIVLMLTNAVRVLSVRSQSIQEAIVSASLLQKTIH